MKRDLMSRLDAWKQSPGRKPLVLSGARQVGKTWILKEFGATRYGNTAYLSFDKTPNAAALFAGDFSLPRVLAGLQALCGVAITPGDTLIILDEIQVCPDALRCLKYWQEDAPGYHVAAAGPLIGLAALAGTGYPVGKTNSLTLYPMGFQEFLAAVGEEKLAEVLDLGDGVLLNALAESFSWRLKEYCFVGGFPAVVKAFAETRSYAAARDKQTEILTGYGRDFGKHAPKAQVPRIRAVWQALPVQLAKADKRFMASEVASGSARKTRARDLRDPCEWLEAAGLIYRAWNVSKPELPLAAYRNHVFKVYGVDVGLLAAQLRLAARTLLDGNRVFTEFNGALAGQFAQQELRAVAGVDPYYWTAANSRAEVDFLLELPAGAVPLEVKAEQNLRAKSLQLYRERFLPAVAVRTSLTGFRRDDDLLNLPLFAVGKIGDFYKNN